MALDFNQFSRDFEKSFESIRRVSDGVKQFRFEEAVVELGKLKESLREVEDVMKEKEDLEQKARSLEEQLKDAGKENEKLEKEIIELRKQKEQ